MDTMKNILVTRPLSDEQLELACGLGLDPTIVPAIKISFRENGSSIQQSIDRAENPVFVFTSKNGVKAIEKFLAHGGTLPDKAPVYAVGQKTDERLSNSGFSSKTPNEQSGTGLARLILQDILAGTLPADATILHFCGNKRRDEFRMFLNDSEIEVQDIVVYKTELNNMAIPEKPYSAMLFYSPSAVQAYRKSGGFQKQPLPELFAIGPTTAEELSIESGKHVHISPEPDTEVFLRFVAQILSENEVPPRRGTFYN
jgi:uroporphyrinogen-III synthase